MNTRRHMQDTTPAAETTRLTWCQRQRPSSTVCVVLYSLWHSLGPSSEYFHLVARQSCHVTHTHTRPSISIVVCTTPTVGGQLDMGHVGN